jgi:hypothetical protein
MTIEKWRSLQSEECNKYWRKTNGAMNNPETYTLWKANMVEFIKNMDEIHEVYNMENENDLSKVQRIKSEEHR